MIWHCGFYLDNLSISIYGWADLLCTEFENFFSQMSWLSNWGLRNILEWIFISIAVKYCQKEELLLINYRVKVTTVREILAEGGGLVVFLDEGYWFGCFLLQCCFSFICLFSASTCYMVRLEQFSQNLLSKLQCLSFKLLKISSKFEVLGVQYR